MDRTQRQVALYSNSLFNPSGLFYLATQVRSYGCKTQAVAEPPTLKILRRPLRQLFYKKRAGRLWFKPQACSYLMTFKKHPWSLDPALYITNCLPLANI